MVEIRLRAEESLQPDQYFTPDLIWNPHLGYASMGFTKSGRDLLASNGLLSSVVIALFTWRRANDYDVLPSDGSDPNGWWGDAVGLDEDLQPIGSRLWLLLRSTLDRNTAQLCEQYVQEALAPFITQGACATINVTATSNIPQGRLEFIVEMYGENGTLIFNNKFQVLYDQLSAAGR